METYATATILDEIRGERARQIAGHGFDADHDDRHSAFELGKAAAAYLGFAIVKDTTRKQNAKNPYTPGVWPWDAKWWKPTNRRRDLVKAAALIVAEIERLDRAAASAQGAPAEQAAPAEASPAQPASDAGSE
jgi:hypothetical protein